MGFSSKRSASGHLRSICNLFRKARIVARFSKEIAKLTSDALTLSASTEIPSSLVLHPA